jgi:hypothetical protein
VDIGTSEGRRRWEAAASPPLPAVEVGGLARTISTVAELAAAVGVEAPPSLPLLAELEDTVELVEAWHRLAAGLDPVLLRAPTPSRARTTAELAVNVLNPFDLMPEAWETGELPWHPERDEQRAAALTDADLVSWAGAVAGRWAGFVRSSGELLAQPARALDSPRGVLEWGPLVTSQRWHAAFHYRQVSAFLELSEVPLPSGAPPLETLVDIDLPEDVF